MESQIHQLLRRVGIHPDYFGYALLAYAVKLATLEPERLLCITKTIYPQVAQRYHTKISCVERNLRTVIAQSWSNQRETLQEVAGYDLQERPTNSHMIALLSCYLLKGKQGKQKEKMGRL